ncbi:MAG: hypothetical protein FJ333_01980 [Sphingomonadales bacterium]|nr:hypothetical protein [Sphingomonadales bacterium]
MQIYDTTHLQLVFNKIFRAIKTLKTLAFSCFFVSALSATCFSNDSNDNVRHCQNSELFISSDYIQNKKYNTPLFRITPIFGPLTTLNDTNQNKKLSLPPWISNMIHDTMSSKKPRFLLYPTIGYSPETKWEFGLSTITVFHFNNDTTLRLSEISAFGFYTQERQLGLWIDHAVYGKDNKLLTLGKMRFQNYPLSYYGIGNDISKKPLALVDATYYNIRERIIYRLKNNFFAGLEFDYQQLLNPEFKWKSTLQSPLPLGANGSKNLGLGLGLVLDSRHNILNVRNGYLGEIAFINYPSLFATSSGMNTLFLDGRYFIPTSKKQVLALQIVGQFSSGMVPFNQLSLMGGETIMRGYYLGRYRDKNYIATQIEYRFLPFNFSKRLGGAVFGSVGSVANKFPTTNFKWSTGAGLRYLIFPKKDIFTRIDVGFNPDGYGIYFYIGEAF